MNAEILCIGTEVLIGDIVNTNAAYLGKRLSEAGISVYYHSVCGDNPSRIRKSLELALSRSDLVVTTGGLGPTYDDITKETAAELFGLPLEQNQEVLERLQDYFSKSGRVMTENNRKQALIPKGADILRNDNGTADGIALHKDGKTLILLPGPPFEVMPLVDNHVIPYIAAKTDHILVSSNVNIFGLGESAVETALAELMKTSVNPTVAPYIGEGYVRVRVTANAKDKEAAYALIKPVVKTICDTLGDVVFGVDEPSIEAVLVRELQQKGKTVAFAESCTGGLISKRITDIPGASDVFGFGFCTYANQAKTRLLGVKAETLGTYGAVSEQTASEMALGALSVSGSDIAVAVTGIAGPGGGTPQKPVGLVYMGIASKKGVRVKKLLLAQNKANPREVVRTLTANHAFMEALKELKALS